MIEKQFSENVDIWSDNVNFRIIDFGLASFFDSINDIRHLLGSPETVCTYLYIIIYVSDVLFYFVGA